jgi:hypothetical protein
VNGSPGVHNKTVVDTNTDDVVDTLGLEYRRQLFITRQMRCRTGWRERSGKREDDNDFPLEQFCRGDILPALVIPSAECDLWNGLTFFVMDHVDTAVV